MPETKAEPKVDPRTIRVPHNEAGTPSAGRVVKSEDEAVEARTADAKAAKDDGPKTRGVKAQRDAARGKLAGMTPLAAVEADTDDLTIRGTSEDIGPLEGTIPSALSEDDGGRHRRRRAEQPGTVVWYSHLPANLNELGKANQSFPSVSTDQPPQE
jgi:hypothetical protein